jgi:hypothetical protein
MLGVEVEDDATAVGAPEPATLGRRREAEKAEEIGEAPVPFVPMCASRPSGLVVLVVRPSVTHDPERSTCSSQRISCEGESEPTSVTLPW